MLKQIILNYEEYATIDELPAADQVLLSAATAVLPRAAPQFSQFQVAAAARLSDGSVHTSTNKENTSIITCAEQNLLLSLHSQYATFAIQAVAITYNNLKAATSSATPITPCGKCRQLLLEAEQQPVRIIMAGQGGNVYVVTGVGNLLPLAYSGELLQL